MRLVLDTNVLVSAFHFPGGPPELVYRLALEGRVKLITSRPLLTELARVLGHKFDWDASRTQRAIEQVVRIAAVVEPTETLTVVAADPADDRVLEAVAEGDTDLIVSGDRHLLRLRSWRDMRILTPAELLAEFE